MRHFYQISGTRWYLLFWQVLVFQDIDIYHNLVTIL